MIGLANFRQAYQLKSRIAKHILNRPDVQGVGVGLKKPGSPEQGAAVIIYSTSVSATKTNKKKHKKTTPPSLKMLARKSGVPIRIVKCSKFVKHNYPFDLKYRSKIRPLIAGYSVGTKDGSGTAGLIVSCNNKKGSKYILSNNHVLVNENTKKPSLTLQPGAADLGIPKKDVIGCMNRFVRLKKRGINYIDGATSKPFSPRLVTPAYAVFGKVNGHVRSYKVGDCFKKVGRTTGLVHGIVDSTHTDIQVNYGPYGNLGTILFKNQSVVRGRRPVSLAGDSGSVWLTHKGNRAAAVNFAGSADGKMSISYPVEWFMQVFNTSVANGSHKKYHRRNKVKSRYLHTAPLPKHILRKIKVLTPKKCCKTK